MSATLSFSPRTFVPTVAHSHPRARPTTAITCQWTPPRRPRNEPVPARDRVIDFGKHKGKMMGALPSGYLKWMSGNLRHSGTEEWAVLADQVQADPVYRERFEWEFADRIMTGDRGGMVDECGVKRLMEVKDRFGWDFEDKAGWRKIKFDLLGTSYGGSIPRVKEGIQPEAAAEEEEEEVDVSELDPRARRRERRKGMRRVEVRESKLGFLSEGKGNLGNSQEIGSGGDKKDESVERRWFPGREGKLGISLKGRGSSGNAQESSGNDVILNGRFPGREGLLRRVLNRRRSSS